MASSLEFVQYVCEQIRDAGNITYKKMFGEYGIYCDGKIIGVICDNQFFVKETEAGKAVMPNCQKSAPYKGAKLYFLIDSLEDKEKVTELIMITYHELPAPKRAKR